MPEGHDNRAASRSIPPKSSRCFGYIPRGGDVGSAIMPNHDRCWVNAGTPCGYEGRGGVLNMRRGVRRSAVRTTRSGKPSTLDEPFAAKQRQVPDENGSCERARGALKSSGSSPHCMEYGAAVRVRLPETPTLCVTAKFRDVPTAEVGAFTRSPCPRWQAVSQARSVPSALRL